jgi:hypothetical protein
VNGIEVAEFLRNARTWDDLTRMEKWAEIPPHSQSYINLQLGLDTANKLDTVLIEMQVDIAAIREAQRGPWIRLGRNLGIFTGGALTVLLAWWRGWQ